jgi:hypothetical protein
MVEMAIVGTPSTWRWWVMAKPQSMDWVMGLAF